ncbi:MAG: zinc-dependent alcohol dehydrogenase family protein [Alphaproteobacteria bacterium]|nr:zinc-dependent alcohol dehydrogenase family protein [Alphaproteobacteria bacterium]
MRAMVLDRANTPLVLRTIDDPTPGPDDVLIGVRACGVCRTDLHIVDGELTGPKLPIIPGHEIVGEVIAVGERVERFEIGERVGVPWLGHTCGACHYCASGHENLCDAPGFSGYTIDGGYAAQTGADQQYVFALPSGYSDAEAAPLLCAGLIGYRSLRMAGDAARLGVYGFGAAAHIVAQVALFEGHEVFAFTKPGDQAGQDFARGLGAVWAGGSDERPPQPLDAAILYAPVGALVPIALKAVRKGGTVVCAGIHMSDIPAFPYEILWEERTVRSVANLTRRDGEEFLTLAPQVPIKTVVETFPLADANEALNRLRNGQITGAAVLIP